MYLNFHGLTEKPFNATPDPKFLLLTAGRREALTQLLYGVQEHKGFILLTGEVGTGKTTLLRALVQRLDGDTAVAFLSNSKAPFDEILEYLLHQFGVKAGQSRAERLVGLNHFLIERQRAGQNTVVIFDDAHNLDIETLKQIRLLSNFETRTHKLLQILLVGPPELKAKLQVPELRQLKQRIGLRSAVPLLTPEETRDYIWTRLRLAGARDLTIFAEDAVDRISEYAAGIPRVVNIVCDHCLLIGYAEQTHRIDRDIVERAVQGLERGVPTGSAKRASGARATALAPAFRVFLGRCFDGLRESRRRITLRVPRRFLRQSGARATALARSFRVFLERCFDGVREGRRRITLRAPRQLRRSTVPVVAGRLKSITSSCGNPEVNEVARVGDAGSKTMEDIGAPRPKEDEEKNRALREQPAGEYSAMREQDDGEYRPSEVLEEKHPLFWTHQSPARPGLTPDDIRSHQFTRRLLRGIDAEEVSAFLRDVAERIKMLEDEVRSVSEREKDLSEAFVTAQQVGERIRSRAEKEAEHRAQEAEEQARSLLGRAKEQEAAMLEDIEHRRATCEEQVRERLREAEGRADAMIQAAKEHETSTLGHLALLRASAVQELEGLVRDAQVRAQGLIESAQEREAAMLRELEALKAETKMEAEQQLAEAKARAESLVSVAKEREAAIRSDIEALNRRRAQVVQDLRATLDMHHQWLVKTDQRGRGDGRGEVTELKDASIDDGSPDQAKAG